MRVGADVGGTFTDVLLRDPDGRLRFTKVLSTPPAYDRAVVDAVCELAGADGAAVESVSHGTTVATNAVLERRGARTALVTTEGFRDVLELRRMRMPHLYDYFWTKPPSLVARRLRFEIAERVTAGGEVLKPLEETDARALAARLREAEPEAIAVCLLHAHVHPAHERRLGEILREELPGIPVSLSSEILREQQEYERTATTVVNAYVRPLMGRYVGDIRRGLDAAGIDAPLTIMQSSGGLMTAEDAAVTAGLRARVGPRRRRRRRPRAGPRARPRERDHLRHGRNDREGLADRGRPRLAQPRVRGRRVALRRQPAPARQRRADPDPDDRHRRGRRGRRLDRLARPRGRPARRPAQRRRGPGACLLRPRRHGADRDRRERRPRLHPDRPARRRRPERLVRARRAGGREARWAARPLDRRGGAGNPRPGERDDDARAARRLDGEGSRPVRLRADRLRRLRPGPRGGPGRRARGRHGRRAAARGALLRGRAALRPRRVPRRALLPGERARARLRRARAARRGDARCADRVDRRRRLGRVAAPRRRSLPRPELEPDDRLPRRARPRGPEPARGAVRDGARASLRDTPRGGLADRHPRRAHDRARPAARGVLAAGRLRPLAVPDGPDAGSRASARSTERSRHRSAPAPRSASSRFPARSSSTSTTRRW